MDQKACLQSSQVLGICSIPSAIGIKRFFKLIKMKLNVMRMVGWYYIHMIIVTMDAVFYGMEALKVW